MKFKKIALNDKNNIIFAGCEDGRIKLYDDSLLLFDNTKNFNLLSITKHASSVTALKSYSNILYSAGGDGSLKSWNFTGNPISRVLFFFIFVFSVAFKN